LCCILRGPSASAAASTAESRFFSGLPARQGTWATSKAAKMPKEWLHRATLPAGFKLPLIGLNVFCQQLANNLPPITFNTHTKIVDLAASDRPSSILDDLNQAVKH
jgi:hypothetical protein